ncbi:hypothetical protein FHR20_003732 [Sphingomonas leidyi]|uniref:DUF1795 domain-containing protein n=1 Tax=Sphingomonas leidyi TaxID=68569 RepID=A0A7X5V2L4_9SPHN|nr:hypothetical protein [Sphingomonas leidyi]NIJ66756.1 hypothetical protein [Sphingomonas leidyi]
MELLAIVLGLFGASASAQGYDVAASGRLVDRDSCYSFQVPAGWKVVAGNPIPLLVSGPPGERPYSLQTLPRGFATLAIGRRSDEAKSIEELMELRRRANAFSSTRSVSHASVTGITRAVEARWTDNANEPGEQTIALFFVFREQPFAAYLSFYRSDRRRGQYPIALDRLLASVRPLAGSTGCAVPAGHRDARRSGGG